jgi:hypothetical protein
VHRRTIALGGLVAVGVVLVVLVKAPVRLTGRELVRGSHVLRVDRADVRGIDVDFEGRHFAAVRSGEGWQLDGGAASAGAADALNDLLDLLVDLRAVDVFRASDPKPFGFDPPRGTVELVTPGTRRRLVIGGLNTAGSVAYARRDQDPRVYQVGIFLLSSLERVFYQRDGAKPAGAD